jgi:hypothetical protein
MVKGNHQRLVYVDIDEDVIAAAFEPVSTWEFVALRA